MKRFLTKKTAAVVLTTGLVMGAGGVAFAYFTSTGSGTGHASVGTTTDNIEFTTSGPAALYPGAPNATAQAFDVIATNGGSAPEHIGSVSISLMTSGSGPSQLVTDESGAPVDGCLSSWFTITSSATIDQTVAAGDHYTLSGLGEPTIQLVESATDQTGCAGHSVGIQFGTPV